MNIFYSRNSLKYLSRQEKEVRLNIVSAIERLPDKGDIQKIRGQSLQNLFRLRVGKNRILFVRQMDTIKILDIDTRGDIYK
jgi:mRNA-degrading endonuclease RelE of RelBE toxin-antitoxin system